MRITYPIFLGMFGITGGTVIVISIFSPIKGIPLMEGLGLMISFMVIGAVCNYEAARITHGEIARHGLEIEASPIIRYLYRRFGRSSRYFGPPMISLLTILYVALSLSMGEVPVMWVLISVILAGALFFDYNYDRKIVRQTPNNFASSSTVTNGETI